MGTNFGATGPSGVTVMQDGDHTFYHPTVMGEGGVHHPVILWGNGTGASPSSYDALLRHFASHGFIVAAANTPNAGSGREMVAGLDKLVAWNGQAGNRFQGKVNTDDAGATGHSQGGGGAIEAGADRRVATVFPLQPWRGDVSGITGGTTMEPTAFYMAGQSDSIVSPASVQQKFNASNGIAAAWGELRGASHFVPAGNAGGFRYAATAWARMILMDDPNTHQVFFGDDAQLANSSEWSRYDTNARFDAIDHSDHGDGEMPGGGETPGEHCEPGTTPTVEPAPAPSTFGSWLSRLFSRWWDRDPAPTPTTTTTTAAPHDCDDGHDGGETPGDGDGGETPDDGHGHDGPTPPAGCTPQVPYTATPPVELCGLAENVTPAQEEWAENLVDTTIERLPELYPTVQAAEQAGFRNIGDGVHWLNWSWIDDGHTFNPERPESLVFQRGRLSAAMYMEPTGTTIEDAPNPAGDLIQWHVHGELCYSADYRTGATAPRLAGIADSSGNCRWGTYPGPRTPMTHVWIVPHRCGAFAALDGLAGGQIAPGEEVSCLDSHEH